MKANPHEMLGPGIRGENGWLSLAMMGEGTNDMG